MAGRIGREVYRTREWALLRLAKLRSTNWRCEQCGKYAREVHHLVPLHAGGPGLPRLTACVFCAWTCHRGVHRTKRRSEWNRLLVRVRRGLAFS